MSLLYLIKNCFSVVTRRFLREKAYVIINIGGLAVGLACCLVTSLYLNFQLGYDHSFDKHERIYRVIYDSVTNNNYLHSAYTSASLGPILVNDFPEVAQAIRFQPLSLGNTLLNFNSEAHSWSSVYYTDSNVFDVFSHEVIFGDTSSALIEPNTIAISQSMAQTYFGSRNPIGERLRYGNEEFQVTLVFSELPENTHLSYDALISYSSRADANQSLQVFSLFSPAVYTYLLMPNGYQPEQFQQISESIYTRYMAEFGEPRGTSVSHLLEPLTKAHHFSKAQYDQPQGSVFNLAAFAIVSLFILLVACINYVNLAMVRSLKHLRELSIRKLLGARNAMLLAQQISEALLFVVLALVASVFLADLAVKLFPLEQLLQVGSKAPLRPLNNLSIVGVAALLSGVVAIASVTYPMVRLIRSTSVLAAAENRLMTQQPGTATARQFLFTVQFTIAVAVISSSFLVMSQIQFLLERSLGFDQHNKVVIEVRDASLIERLPSFMDVLRQHNSIDGVSSAAALPGEQVFVNLVTVETERGPLAPEKFSQIHGDHNLLEVLSAELVIGRGFSQSRELDRTGGVIVNEAAVRQMGWENPIGKRYQNTQGLDAEVIGVVKDFHFADFHSEVTPLAIVWQQPNFEGMTVSARIRQIRQLMIAFQPGSETEAIEFIQQSWSAFSPEQPFEYVFFDQLLERQYSDEKSLGSLVRLFSIICVLLSCLGLFGLSAYTTRQRYKEIGIRKVLGATTLQIFKLLYSNIVPIMLMGSALGSIIAYLAINRWLEAYYFQTALNYGFFFLATFIVAFFSFGTVSLQSSRATRQSPSLMLKVE